ncbi:FAD-dependent oxidoreductase [Bosea sp. 685]|uniref:FAD-dependent oxidoreductase n=1 Tax=Bosea sp. 685 TaxID=3080057 RepID=UPI002893680C|nr:FAD-dependent oxidoreductase [Bosea sp. 685]WNJ88021.1 FAD-dependent monooxygenase [Bosea sp. 685]
MIESTRDGYRIPTFATYSPPSDGEAQTRHPVVVVGGGLCGLTLACDLAARGQPVVLLDEDDTVGVRGSASRGIVYAQKSLEIFDRLGVFDRIASKGIAWSIGRSLVEDEVVYSFDAARGNLSCQPPFLNIQQFYVEWFLAERLHGHPLADVRWGNRLTGVRVNDDFVTLEVEWSGGRYEIEADWVVDCGGLNSTLRNGLALPTYPAKGTERWLICDVRFADALPNERWTWIRTRANDGRAVWRHPMADGIWRIDFQLDAGDDTEPSEETCRALLRRLLGPDVAFDLIWYGPWASRTHLLDNFRRDRILFAGDSAHVFPPFGARGGNSGIQDADNLGWKLALVLAGLAPARLLDSYDLERRAAAVHNTRVASRSLSFVSPATAQERLIQEQVIALARRYPFARSLVNTGRLSEAFTYPRSDFVADGGGASVPNAAFVCGDGRAGTLVDIVGGIPSFVLLTRDGAPPAAVDPLLRVFTVGPGEEADIRDPAGDLGGLLGLAGHEGVLVRPDLHVAGYLDDVGAENVAVLLGRALGARAPGIAEELPNEP